MGATIVEIGLANVTPETLLAKNTCFEKGTGPIAAPGIPRAQKTVGGAD